MLEAKLGVTTCDKCQEPMLRGQPVLVIAEGNIADSNYNLTFDGSCVRYACHLSCWDGCEEVNDDMRSQEGKWPTIGLQ